MPITKTMMLKKRKGSRTFVAAITHWADKIAFSWKVREEFYSQIANQQSNGIAIEAILALFRQRLQRQKRISSDKIIADVARKMRDGSTLANALSEWIPQDEVFVISSGELAGKLPDALRLLIDSKRRIAKVTAALKSAAISPAVYLLAVYGLVWVIGVKVIPTLEQVLPYERSSGLVRGLFIGGRFANSWFAILPPIIAVIVIYAVLKSFPKWTGKYRIFAEQFFPYSYYRDIQGYTWLGSFTALFRAGVSDVEILKRQTKLASPWLKERLHSVSLRMENGKKLSEALMEKGKNGMPPFGFPNPDIVEEIAVINGFPDFAEKMSLVSIQWADELESKTLARAKKYGFWMEVIMYGVIGILMMAINAMSTQLGNIPGM